jgi:DNA-binding NarL/FixJ family response regulator
MRKSPRVAQNLVRCDTATRSVAVNALTERECEVLQAIARGQSIKAIARAMGLTPRTVSNHQSAIKQKLAVESTYQLLKVAGQLGLSR